MNRIPKDKCDAIEEIAREFLKPDEDKIRQDPTSVLNVEHLKVLYTKLESDERKLLEIGEQKISFQEFLKQIEIGWKQGQLKGLGSFFGL